jgi:outer membrane protein assembly factor BamD (BamD/ComL family)
MKKIILFFAMATFMFSACNFFDNVNKDRERMYELRKQLYDKNSLLTSYEAADAAIEAFRAFGNKYPKDTAALPFHIEAAEIAWTMTKFPLSIEIFEEIVALHPESDLLPYVYLRLGSIYNDAIKDTVNAKKYYTLLLEKYPESDFVEGAQFGIETLGMTEKEQFDYLLRKSGQEVAEEVTE